MDSIELRLNRLERENRRLRQEGAVLVVALIIVAVMVALKSPVAEAQTITSNVIARGFTLVNHQGEIVATLDLLNDGRPCLTFYSASSPERLGSRTVALMLSSASDAYGGGAFIGIGSSREGGEILLRTYEDGRMPFIQIYNARGQVIWGAP